MNSISKEFLSGIMYASVTSVVWNELFERFNKIDGPEHLISIKRLLHSLKETASVLCISLNLKICGKN